MMIPSDKAASYSFSTNSDNDDSVRQGNQLFFCTNSDNDESVRQGSQLFFLHVKPQP